jgi:OmpA-OmpF porin, OOP family
MERRKKVTQRIDEKWNYFWKITSKQVMHKLLTIMLLLLPLLSLGQTDFSGNWQGIFYQDGQTYRQGQVIWLEIRYSGTKIEGFSRHELFDTPNYALKKIRGTQTGPEIYLEEFVVTKKKSTSSQTWCNLNMRMKYNPETGYLEGTYTSSDCRRSVGKIILFKSDNPVSKDDEMTLTHAWAKQFADDLSKGKKAPYLRAQERAEFEFKPIYFDYDKAEIRPEYHTYLKKMAEIVLDHSDLRIKVTGHTDGDGSDEYNLELSERRAKAIREFFMQHGLREDRIQIDFKGKRQPVAPNESSEGKQLNRRVDFSFI